MLGLGLVLGLFSALLGPANFAMICSGHGHLCLTGCRNRPSAPSTDAFISPTAIGDARASQNGTEVGRTKPRDDKNVAAAAVRRN